MCRFLLAKFAEATPPAALLDRFAFMAQNSRGSGDAWQGDGWGITWLNAGYDWQGHKSLQPIWQDTAQFASFPATCLFLVHARSASFPHHKNVIDYNQPYHNADYAFVFNGLLQGVTLPRRLAPRLPGAIGAQKIWSLLQEELLTQPPALALEKLRTTLIEHTKTIKALNVGLADKTGGYAFCSFADHADYYTLHLHRSPVQQMICSEPLAGYPFTPLTPNQVMIV